MANFFQSLIRKAFLGKHGNLTSFDDAYSTAARLLKGKSVTGIMDIGASNGRISKRLLKLFPTAQTYAFEPNPLYRNTLTDYAESEKRFHPQFLALSNEDSTVELQITASPGSTSLFTPGRFLKNLDPQGSVITKTEKVECLTIDHWLEKNNNPDIQVMKFDIQGGELNAMKGAVNVLEKKVLLIYTEILFNPLYDGGAVFSDIDKILRDQGFVLYNIYKPRADKNDTLLWGNAIYVHAERLGL